MKRRSGIVTLLTDFGEEDGFVGTMKGVLLGIHPAATLVDLSHRVPPQDVRRAALILQAAVPYFPPGTVHLAVVDPGVGTHREAIVVDAGDATFVGPDNGLFGPVLSRYRSHRAFRIERGGLPNPSQTFHGRDLFAPAAGRVAAGASPSSLGSRLQTLQVEDWPEPRRTARGVSGEVAFSDHFGNLVTNIEASMLPAPPHRCRVRIGRRSIRGIRTTYGEVRRGTLLALIESTGHLEVAVREGSAAHRLGLGAGARVTVGKER